MDKERTSPVLGDPSTWPLVGARFVRVPCDYCKESGKIPFSDWQRPDGQWVKGGGFKPCPKCLGKRYTIMWACDE